MSLLDIVLQLVLLSNNLCSQSRWPPSTLLFALFVYHKELGWIGSQIPHERVQIYSNLTLQQSQQRCNIYISSKIIESNVHTIWTMIPTSLATTPDRAVILGDSCCLSDNLDLNLTSWLQHFIKQFSIEVTLFW